MALVRAVREGMGPDSDMMLDAWMSWDLRYAKLMAPRIAEYRPRWIEEPALPDKPEICAQIRQAMPFPVSNGEHEYTRWGMRRLLELGAQDVLQPDIYWAGGITETLKICALASAYDIEVIPHGHSSHATAHFIASQSPGAVPDARVPDQVEHDPPVLCDAQGRAGGWLCGSASGRGHGHGDRQKPGRVGAGVGLRACRPSPSREGTPKAQWGCPRGPNTRGASRFATTPTGESPQRHRRR